MLKAALLLKEKFGENTPCLGAEQQGGGCNLTLPGIAGLYAVTLLRTETWL